MNRKIYTLADLFNRNDRSGNDYMITADSKVVLQAVRVAESIQVEVPGSDDTFRMRCTKAQARELIKDATSSDGRLGFSAMLILDGTLILGGAEL